MTCESLIGCNCKGCPSSLLSQFFPAYLECVTMEVREKSHLIEYGAFNKDPQQKSNRGSLKLHLFKSTQHFVMFFVSFLPLPVSLYQRIIEKLDKTSTEIEHLLK